MEGWGRGRGGARGGVGPGEGWGRGGGAGGGMGPVERFYTGTVGLYTVYNGAGVQRTVATLELAGDQRGGQPPQTFYILKTHIHIVIYCTICINTVNLSPLQAKNKPCERGLNVRLFLGLLTWSRTFLHCPWLPDTFFYNVFTESTEKKNTLQIRSSKRGAKRSTWLFGYRLEELPGCVISLCW